MEVPKLRVLWELQLPATARAMPDPSHICHLHHSSWQRWILNPLSKARDRTCHLMVPTQICFRCHDGNSENYLELWIIISPILCT